MQRSATRITGRTWIGVSPASGRSPPSSTARRPRAGSSSPPARRWSRPSAARAARCGVQPCGGPAAPWETGGRSRRQRPPAHSRQGSTERADSGTARPAARAPATALEAAREGLVDRGGAQPGHKTMVDALEPAVRTLKERLAAGSPDAEAFAAAREAAEAGMQSTVPLQATKGRASYLGERSIGHQDPGATSTALILRALELAIAAEQ